MLPVSPVPNLNRTKSIVLAAILISADATLANGLAAAVQALPEREESTATLGLLTWEPLPDLPDEVGVAGPFVGVHNDALIVAGGANFPVDPGQDLWRASKVWHDQAWVLERCGEGYVWHSGYKLNRPIAYGMCVNTPWGVLCIGGSDGEEVLAEAFLLRWDSETKTLKQNPLPALPQPLAHGAATIIGDTVYVVGGQSGAGLESAGTSFYRLKLPASAAGLSAAGWEELPAWPGPPRAFNIAVAQHNGFDDCVYLVGGRRQRDGTLGAAGIIPLADIYEFNPQQYDATRFDPATGVYSGRGEFAKPWRRRRDAPKPIMAGTAIPIGQSHLYVMAHADGDLLANAVNDPDFVKQHPGFPRQIWSYHTITDRWVAAGTSPSNQVTTPAATWGDNFVIASGEVRPRVRTRNIWLISATSPPRSLHAIDLTVVVMYLLAILGVGFFFAKKQKNTNDFFRGGKQVVWWAAACSIFATMLSSITFMAIPAKAYAQNWVYLVGNMMILAVAPIAVYLALPFFRRIDATSAYEYLELRFNRAVRQIASALFTLFHVFRMAIVMSLAALALAAATGWDPGLCVMIMGLLSMAYCALGGVEAVIWTDTLQTVVLLGGAVICFLTMMAGIEGGFVGFFQSASVADKFHAFNFHLDPTSTSLALWVVLIGATGQNLSSYTADQAVVQRYMTMSDEQRARRSIWLAAGMAVPASILFFGLGTALFVFYQSNPEQLDPTFTTDQIFPLFIVDQMPIGLAGLIVAGIFAAAQSTVSTSMNSTTTAVVTDFIQPAGGPRQQVNNLQLARVLTVGFGIAGTLLGMLFVHPDIKSLFDQFLKVIGLFMGVLGGAFALGMLTTRCTGAGALIGLMLGAGVMFALPLISDINGYLYAAIGLSTCGWTGYLASFLTRPGSKSLAGLTIHTLPRRQT